jgi:hypothetical protein
VQPLRGSGIEHVPAFQGKKFLNLSPEQVNGFFGKSTYLQRYGKRIIKGCCTDLEASPFKEELDAWVVSVHVHGLSTDLIACGEDVQCCDHKHGANMNKLCAKCEVPLCSECLKSLRAKPAQQPPLGLCNDTWTGYSSDFIYESNVTYLELLCASPCCLSLICFILQNAQGSSVKDESAKRPKKPMFLEPAFKQAHRTAARGNITMWPMPLTDILDEMRRLEKDGVDLPRSGKDLSKIVKVLLKSAGKLPASLIAHATVRRAEVMRLIEDGKVRGHPSYKDAQKNRSSIASEWSFARAHNAIGSR